MASANRFDNSLDWANPLIYDLFINALGRPTEPQRMGWPSILSGKSTLITAPTE
jgi:ATP-dependent Lhr-like helicase